MEGANERERSRGGLVARQTLFDIGGAANSLGDLACGEDVHSPDGSFRGG